jgi:hypothetical protein
MTIRCSLRKVVLEGRASGVEDEKPQLSFRSRLLESERIAQPRRALDRYDLRVRAPTSRRSSSMRW